MKKYLAALLILHNFGAHSMEIGKNIASRYLEWKEDNTFDVSQEIYTSSRPAKNARERKASEDMINELKEKSIKIDEIRFIDATTLINSFALSQERKNMLLKLVDSSDNIDELIEKFVCNSYFYDHVYMGSIKDSLLKEFPDDALLVKDFVALIYERCGDLENYIRESLLEGIRCDPIYRNLMLVLIGWRDSGHFSCDLVTRHFRPECNRNRRGIAFANSDRESSCAEYNIITIGSRYFSYNSFFHCPYALNSSYGLSYYKAGIARILFHEIGHVTSANMSSATSILGLDQDSYKITASLFDIEFYEDIVQEKIELIKKMPPEEATIFREVFKGEGITLPESADGMAQYFRPIISSKEGMVTFTYTSTAEILQILGFFTVTHLGSNVMYINTLSDFTLYASQGFPIRFDHTSNDYINNEKNIKLGIILNKLKLSSCYSHYRMNRPLYKILFDLHGQDIGEYEENLSRYIDRIWMFPYASLRQALVKMKEMSDKIANTNSII
ncbi:MAG: hypothetical protein LBB25_02960 [Holosporaceae bacterium]|jgi:hypothetical protein|nr:hypothetical protein [Holosporaceae bacterium]